MNETLQYVFVQVMIDYFSFETLIHSRRVSKNFKEAIDKNPIWKKHITLFRIMKTTDLCLFNFLIIVVSF